MNVHEITAEKEINLFCDGLRESLLRYVREKSPVCIEQRHDVEPAGDPLDKHVGGSADRIWMGGSVTIHFGRPASTALLRRNA